MTTIHEKRCLGCGAGLERDSLRCDYCGMSHVVSSGGGIGAACSRCGAGNPGSARSCTQCRETLGMDCPECSTFNPLGARFCQECRIEFRTYRQARLRYLPNRLPAGEVEGCLVAWLDSRWFKARDLRQHLRVIEKTLTWVPRWSFQARAQGNVQGQVAQTHYRTVSTPVFDEEGRRSERVRSMPYEVWDHVNKDFEEKLRCSRPACRAAGAFNGFVTESGLAGSEPLEHELGGPGERAFQPDQGEPAAFRQLRAKAIGELEGTLLDKVERLEVRLDFPRLTLLFTPVWHVIYRYKSAHGDARMHGVTRHVDGKKISLLTQWFA